MQEDSLLAYLKLLLFYSHAIQNKFIRLHCKFIIHFHIVIDRLTIVKMEHNEKCNLGRKGIIKLILPCHCLSLKGARTETQIGQESGGRS